MTTNDNWWSFSLLQSDFNDKIVPAFNAGLSQGLIIMGFQYYFQRCAQISPDSLNLSMMLCAVDNEIFQVFTIFYYSEIVPQFVDAFIVVFCVLLLFFLQIAEPLFIFTSEKPSGCFILAPLSFPAFCSPCPNNSQTHQGTINWTSKLGFQFTKLYHHSDCSSNR